MLREVKVEEGVVRGLPAADPRISVFKGIPFAKPPVGKLRFAPPQKPEPWEGVRDCYKFSAVCPQAAAMEGRRSHLKAECGHRRPAHQLVHARQQDAE